MELNKDQEPPTSGATSQVAQIPFLFVGGAKRSGTTLVQRLLTAHSQVGGGPEFNFTRDIFQLYRRMEKGLTNNGQDYFYDKPKLDAAFLKLYEGFFEDAYDRNQKQYFSEKTPSNVFVARQFLRFFPKAKYINIIRDGRDVLLSHQEVKNRHIQEGYDKNRLRAFKTGRVSRDWNLAVDAWFTLAADSELKDRIYTLRYPDLILNPETELKKLFTFLELPFEEHLLDPSKIDNDATMINNRWHVKNTHFQPWNPDKIGKWKKGLSLGQKILGNLYMARNLARMKFEIGGFYTLLHSFKKVLPYGLKKRLTS